MKQQLNQLLTKDMTRHEFLATLGFGLISMLGFSSMLKFLLDDSGSVANGTQTTADRGYGNSPYGL